MSLLLWNCRGLGNPRIENDLVSLIQAKDPSVVFIAETWANEARLDRTLSKINFDKKWVVPRLNRGGGLVLFWKNNINIEIVDSHRYFIDMIINGNIKNAWRFTGFYGEPETHRRNEACSKLRSLKGRMNIPWICSGDFNEIVRQEEKWGGAPRDHNQMQLCRDVINECQFMDLGYVGPKFTWAKHYVDGHSIRTRLDQCMATNSWFQKFPGTRVHHLNCMSLDHSPLLINLSGMLEPKKKRCFTFEEMWLSDPTYGDMVEEVWSSIRDSNPSIAILEKVASCEQELTWWNKHNFGHVRRELEKKKKLLVLSENEAMVSGNNTRVRSIRMEINLLQDRESRMWCQRSRMLWLSKRDNNTTFFHSRATKRFRKNLIRGIRDQNGVWVTKHARSEEHTSELQSP